jgi:hypothetical protein
VPFCAYCGKGIDTVRFCPYCGRAAGPVPPSLVRAPRKAFHLRAIFALTGVVSMLIVSLASFMRWVTYPGGNVAGIQRDGKMMLALGLLGALFALVGLVTDSRWPFVPLAILGVAVTALAVIDIIDVSTTAGLGLSNVGIGLFAGAAAGFAAVVSGAGGISLLTGTAAGS